MPIEAAPKGRINLDMAAVMLLCGHTGGGMLTRIFEGFGVRRPYLCHDGRQAMQTCRETDLDLIVCDGSLDGGETYDFIADLRRSDLEPNRFAPVVVIQGYTPLDQIAKARDCGANFVVAKPITPLTLLERILWVAHEQRPFVEMDRYVGPDRRFQTPAPADPPSAGRRRTDRPAEALFAALPEIDPEDALL